MKRYVVVHRHLPLHALLAGTVVLLALSGGCRQEGGDGAVPSSVDGPEAPRLHVDDLPVGDPEQIRELLREHVVEASAGPPRLPELQVGLIRCSLNEGTAWIDPATGHISLQEPEEELHDPRYYDPWQADAVANLPDIGGVRDWDVSPDGALALLLCEVEGGTVDPIGDLYGGVALWDLEADKGWWLIHPVDSVGNMIARMISVHFHDGRFCVTENVDGATNNDIVFWDLSKLPATTDSVGWMGVITSVTPRELKMVGFSHTVMCPGAPNTPVIWWAEGGEMRWEAFEGCEADYGWAVAPDGESLCLTRVAQPEWGDEGPPGFEVHHERRVHRWPRTGDAAGPPAGAWIEAR